MRTVVVVGNGMVGHRFLSEMVATGALGDSWRMVAFGEETQPAYDRVRLSAYFGGATLEDLTLDPIDHNAVELICGEAVIAIDRLSSAVTTDAGRVVPYDALILATGSSPFVPPVDGRDADGCFVYRTIDDLDAIGSWAAGATTGVVVGGGLLGLEAANALMNLGLDTHVVEMAPHLMPAQIDDGGGAALRERIEALGINVHAGVATDAVVVGAGGRAAGVRFGTGEVVDADLVVFSAGIRPRDDLAEVAGLERGDRGGFLVDHTCATADPSVWAIGECAAVDGRCYGLVGPGYEMARVVARRLTGGDDTFPGADMSTKLKLLDVEVASFGDAHGTTDDARSVVMSDPIALTHAKLVVSPDGARLLGGVLVGDASAYGILLSHFRSGEPLPARPLDLLTAPLSVDASRGTVCTCNNVDHATLCAAIADGCTSVADLKTCTRAGTTCGSCTPEVTTILRTELERSGVAVDRSLCEHFAFTRQELFDIVRVAQVRTFAELLAGWGQGHGCEICKPAVASMLASLWNEHVIASEHVSLQDTNDRFLANMQRDGTYSVVPRVPGGEITPDKLIALGEVAKEFDLYTKITGGQRVDLFGARVDQLPAIWQRLVDAGFESGHAYGKALRTVKSCVGQTWCRYGVQDSTKLAVDLELRYRGLRSPHKLKGAVSGCARECAEAQGKDFGVIATDAGWNVYVCGNGGMRPRHAELLATDVDTESVFRYLDRFLMFYVRTAERLERTSVWCERIEGGIDYIRRVVVDDELGLAAELEADMARHIESYRCEWAATLDDAEALDRFTHYVNDDGIDESLLYIRERGQRRPQPVGTPR
ncbi:MAG TPA: nitrite reductase large subunit NirB [Acidimicrobiales bacterium]